MGLRAVTLGHAYPPVVEAVREVLADGIELLPAEPARSWSRRGLPGAGAGRRHGQVRQERLRRDDRRRPARSGGHRSGPGRHLRDQPFFSVDDWFIGTTAMNAGIPSGPRSTVGFAYNDLDSLRALLDAAPRPDRRGDPGGGDRAAEPAPGFLEGLRTSATADGSVLVFDEMITGLRWSAGAPRRSTASPPTCPPGGRHWATGSRSPRWPAAGAHGARRAEHRRRPRVFLLSTTHGAETTGLAAFLRRGRGLRRERPGRLDGAARARRSPGVHGSRRGRARRVHRRRRAARRAWSSARVTPRAARRRRSGRCSCRSCCGAACSASRSSSRRPTPTRTSRRPCMPSQRDGGLPASHRRGDDGVLEGRPVAPALRSTAAPRRLR